jgi:uncharacterized membrane protein
MPVPKRYVRHRAFYFAIAYGVAGAAIAALLLTPWQAIELGSVAFFVSYLAMSLRKLPLLTAKHLRAHADEDDAPVALIFLVTACIVLVSVVSLFQLINAAQEPQPWKLAINIVAVVLGWFVVHTMAAYHYAYEFYESGEDDAHKAVGGLDFPGTKAPDGAAFLYFSYVIGMTAQVADVSITANNMRRLVLLHGVFSFFFNTVIVAATVNVVVSLGH